MIAEYTPSEGTLDKVIVVTRVRSGQPRAYADHERVFRVKITTPFTWDDPQRNIDTIRTLLVGDRKMKEERDISTLSGYAESYVDYITRTWGSGGVRRCSLMSRGGDMTDSEKVEHEWLAPPSGRHGSLLYTRAGRTIFLTLDGGDPDLIKD